MNIDKGILVNIALLIHLALTGLALMKLFRLKNATGGLVIISVFVMIIPILGPSGLIIYLDKLQKKEAKKTNDNMKHISKKKTKK